ncbi:MAG: hypothetical protein KF764_15440 [Labilithrix sp.]|nr:hypothetical protein [Labilithrix sp.]MBX3221014.1 hypothetical protein [Labilithrix sp.]
MTIHVTPPAGPALDAPALASALAPRVAGSSAAADRSRPLAMIGLGAVMLVAVSVFWVFDALPFQDLPAHAGLIAMRHRFETSAFEQRFYVLAPHIGPYSLFRFLGEAFVRVIGPVDAVRALGTLPVVATPLAMLFARRRLYGDTSPSFAFLGVALSFGIMTLLGFASYLLGVAVMLVGLTLWLDLLAAADDAVDARSLLRRELVVAAFAPLMFVAHGHAFLLFLLCAGIASVVTGRRLRRLLRLRALVPALALAGWVAWLERAATTPPGSVPRAHQLIPRFQGPADKLGLLLSPTLMTRTGIDFFVGFLLLAFAVACAVVTVRSLGRRAGSGAAAPADVRHSRALYACAAAIGLAFIALPHAVGWFGFVDGRLVPVTLILALLGIRRAALPRPFTLGLHYGPPVIAATISVLALVASYRFQDEARGYKEVLAHVPAESRLLNLPLDPNSDVFTAHPFIHYDKLVLVERPIVVSDVWFHQGSALYPTPENPALRLPHTYSESNLKVIDWPAYHLEDWDYVLIRTRPNATEPHTPDRLELEEHRGGWWLFRRAEATGS